jgi:diacylglycerol kinase family enzyme
MAGESEAAASGAMTGRNFAIVLNHMAGALIGREDIRTDIGEAFRAHGVAAQFIPPDAGDLQTRIALARDSGADAVVLAGGDGTIACAAQILAGSDMPLGILPFGTMNLLASDLLIPTDLAGAIKVLSEYVIRRVDAGDVNGHVFLCGSMVGMPTVLGQVRESERGRPILGAWWRFAMAALRVFSRHRKMRLVFHAQGRNWRVHTPAVLLTINPLSDGTGRQMGRAILDGGVLAAYVFARLRLMDALRIGFPVLLGRWRGDEAIEEFRLDELSITSNRSSMRVMNDGETMLLRTPLHYTVRRQALCVLAPSLEVPA